MNFYKENGLGGKIYYKLSSSLSLLIGEIKYQIDGSEFQPYEYRDYKYSDKNSNWEVYSFSKINLDEKASLLEKKEIKRWSIKLHSEIRGPIIKGIFKLMEE